MCAHPERNKRDERAGWCAGSVALMGRVVSLLWRRLGIEKARVNGERGPEFGMEDGRGLKLRRSAGAVNGVGAAVSSQRHRV